MSHKSPYIPNSIKHQKTPSVGQAVAGLVTVLLSTAALLALIYIVAFVVASGVAAGLN